MLIMVESFGRVYILRAFYVKLRCEFVVLGHLFLIENNLTYVYDARSIIIWDFFFMRGNQMEYW